MLEKRGTVRARTAVEAAFRDF